MKGFKMFKDKLTNNKFIVSLLINLTFLFLALLFCDMKYEVSDDFIMDAILSGALGHNYNEHLLFSNILYGYLLKFLYSITKKISWYFVFQVVICFVSLTSLCYIVLKRNNSLIGLIFCLIFVSFFSDDLYILVQFTKTATVATCAGGSMFLYAIFYSEKKRKHMIIGALLTLLGSMVRFQCIFIVLIFLFIVFIKYAFTIKEFNTHFFIKNLLYCIILFISVLCVMGVDKIIWNNSPSYKQYRELNELRASVTDIKTYDYSSYASFFESKGLDEIDFHMIESWNLLDQNIYNHEILTNYSTIKKEVHKKYILSVKHLISSFRDRNYQSYTVVWGLILMMFILLFIDPHKFICMIPDFIIAGFLLVYFFIRGRVVYRVEYCIFLCLAVGLITSLNVTTLNNTYKLSLNILGAFILLLKVPLYIPDTNYKTMSDEIYSQYISDTMFRSYDFNIKKYRCDISHRRPHADLINHIESDNEHYYLMDFSSTIQLIYYNYKPWKRLPVGYYNNNYFYLGGVTYGYPSNNTCWAENNINFKSPLKSLVNDKIILVDNRQYTTKFEYLKKYYYKDISAELITTINGFKLWNFHE